MHLKNVQTSEMQELLKLSKQTPSFYRGEHQGQRRALATQHEVHSTRKKRRVSQPGVTSLPFHFAESSIGFPGPSFAPPSDCVGQ